MRVPVFTGACPALVTPFHESGSIDFNALAKLIDYQISAGSDAICVCGTTGESATLSEKEHNQVVEFSVKQANGRLKVIAGSGNNNTAKAIELSCQAQEMGADALLIVTPYYNKATQTGLVRHYESIAERADLPIILYNVPSRTGVSFMPETYQKLAQIPNIIGVKEASGDLSLVIRTMERCPEDFYVWAGNDDQTVPVMALGGKGIISVAANIIPEIMVEMSHLCLHNAFDAASKLQVKYSSLFDALFNEVNPIPIKAAMELLGMCCGHLRLPLCRPSPAVLERLKKELTQFNLL